MASRTRTGANGLVLGLAAAITLTLPAASHAQSVAAADEDPLSPNVRTQPMGAAGAVSAIALAPDAARHVYTFLGDRLEVRVVGVPEGSLRIVRGGPGELEVMGRAPDGIPGSGLERNGSERLNLTAAGSDQAVFLVVVPSHVRVRVLLPDEELRRSFDPPQTVATFDWEAAGPVPVEPEG